MNINEIIEAERWGHETIAGIEHDESLLRIKTAVDAYLEEMEVALDLSYDAECKVLKQRIADLESQVPKVVTPRLEVIGRSYSCPECDSEFIGRRAKYCYNCGAKLNWWEKG